MISNMNLLTYEDINVCTVLHLKSIDHFDLFIVEKL